MESHWRFLPPSGSRSSVTRCFRSQDSTRRSAKKYAEVNRLADELSSNAAAILRDYRDKRLSADAASRALENRALVASPAALLGFVDQLGPYVLGYTAARDKVARYVEAQPADSWSTLRDVLEYSKVALLR